MSFRWEIYCAACRWQAVVEALVPFSHQVMVEHPFQPIDGFWEDYICPEHYHIVRRMLRFFQPMPDLGTAFEAYFEGKFDTTPVPTCPNCDQQMEGGQVLERLPFFLDGHLDAYMWLHHKLGYLDHTLIVERKAVLDGSISADAAVQLLNAEALTISRFFAALLKELALVEAVPFADDLPDSLHGWEAHIATQLEMTQHRIEQLRERQHKETAKIAGCCPQCHQKRVYLHRKETF